MIDAFQNEFENLKLLDNCMIEVGVIEGKSKKRKFVSIGLTNAELMFIHENGSPVKNIPARPVLQITIEYASNVLIPQFLNKAIVGLSTDWTKNKLYQELDKLCIRIQNYAQDVIYSNDGRLAPNAESTIKAKGDNYPLHDTGQLARSITCRYKFLQ